MRRISINIRFDQSHRNSFIQNENEDENEEEEDDKGDDGEEELSSHDRRDFLGLDDILDLDELLEGISDH